MSGVDYLSDQVAINPYMDSSIVINHESAKEEHDAVKEALELAGVSVIKVEPPLNCQDGVYCANWALVRGSKAVMARLPDVRQPEIIQAKKILTSLGKEIYTLPDSIRFSGQGDALPCGDFLLAGNGYRTDKAAHDLVAKILGYRVVTLQTVPKLDVNGHPIINSASGWADSFFYDIDLALSVLSNDLIAWCPEAFVPASQEIINKLPFKKIEVSLDEAIMGFACNLVSTGKTVIMSAHAPIFQAAIEEYGLKTLTPEIKELAKGGGYIRCTALTIDNL